MAATLLLAISPTRPLRGLCRLVLSAVGCVAPLSVSGQQALSLARHQLTDRIDVFSGFANGNVLAIRADSGTLLIDAQSARRVGLVDSALSSLGAGPVKLVINTHYHGDHIEGNAHFRAKGARILAHQNVSVQAVKDTVIPSWDNWHRTPAAVEALPTMTFSDSSVLRYGDEEVRIYHAPNAHTDGDAIVWLRRANIIHMGDIFELGAPPFIDWWVGGSAGGMIAAIDRVLPWIDGRTRVVPGHGPISDRATLVTYRAMLVTMQGRVQVAIDVGKSLDEIVAAKPAAEFEARLGGARYGDHLTKLFYAGLSRRPAPRPRP